MTKPENIQPQRQMVKSHKIDLSIRVIISVIYRFILIGFAVVILILYPNKLQTSYYIIFIGLYISLYVVLFKNNSLSSKLRLINDYLFIYGILVGKPLDLITYPFLLIPIFNSPNHTGAKRGFLTYLFTVIIMFLTIEGRVPFVYFIPLLFISVIDALEHIRSRLLRFSNLLYDSIDEFYLEDVSLKKGHLIYTRLKSILNRSKFRFFFLTNEIVCIKLRNNRAEVVNASLFVYDYALNLGKQEIAALSKGEILKNIPVQINKVKFENTLIISTRLKEESYAFIFLIDNLRIWFFCNYYLRIYFKPILKKISVILRVEKEIRDERDLYIKKMKDKLYYVSNATLAMHFLRNKFSPIKNYLEMIEEAENVSREKRSQFNNILDMEHVRAKR